MNEKPISPLSLKSVSPNEYIIQSGGEISKISLELGDIIRVNGTSPSYIAYVDYLDEFQICLLLMDDNKEVIIRIKDGIFEDKLIHSIELLTRSDKKGYASQNGLELNQWIEIHYITDTSEIKTMTGKITDKEEDMIEITPLPTHTNELTNVVSDTMQPIYIDFAYQGMPRDTPIRAIFLRDEPPEALVVAKKLAEQERTKYGEGEEAYTEQLENGERILHIPEHVKVNQNPRQIITMEYLESFDDDQEFIRYEEVAEHQKRYGVEAQTTELMEEWLLDVSPNMRRNPFIITQLTRGINRYRQLRERAFVFDKNGTVIDFRKFKNVPTIDAINNYFSKTMDKPFPKWIVPVIHSKKNIYDDIDNITDVSIYGETQIELLSIKNEMIKASEWKFGPEPEGKRKKNALSEEANVPENQYRAFLSDMNEFLRPYSENNNIQMYQYYPFLQSSIPKTPITVAVANDNLHVDTGKSFVYKNNGMGVSKFHTYQALPSISYPSMIEMDSNTGIKHNVFTTVSNTADTLHIHSSITYPTSVIEYSRIYDVKTDMITRTDLGRNSLYRYFLPKPTTNWIEKPLLKRQSLLTTNPDIFKKTQHHIFSPDYYSTLSDITLSTYLEHIIPTPEELLVIATENQPITQLSVKRTLDLLTPYLVSSDTIGYGTYINAKQYVYNTNKTYSENRGKGRNAFQQLLASFPSYTEKQYEKANTILQLVATENKELIPYVDAVTKMYFEHSTTSVLSSEYMMKIIGTDEGEVYYLLLTFLLLHLRTPDTIIESSVSADDTTTMPYQNDVCNQRVIAKVYKSLEELVKDNNNQAIFDPVYDPILKSELYKEIKVESDKIPMTDRQLFIKKYLQEQGETDVNTINKLALTIATGRRKIEMGNYALLEVLPDIMRIKPFKDEAKTQKKTAKEIIEERNNGKVYHYYIRRNDFKWERATDMANVKTIPSNDDFCNLGDNCGLIQDTGICENITLAEEVMDKAINKAKRDEELAKNFYEGITEYATVLGDRLQKEALYLSRTQKIRKYHAMRDDLYALQLGKQIIESIQIESPYLSLRQYVLSQTNFVKRQNNIIQFYTKYCRTALPTNQESTAWGYCIETDTPLFPVSLYQVALGFVQGRYADALADVERLYGELSEDGEAVVDKYTGYVLRKIDESTDEGFTEDGFRQVTRSVLERDATEVIKDVIFQNSTQSSVLKERLPTSDPRLRVCYATFDILVTKTGLLKKDVEDKSIEEFVIGHTMQIVGKTIMSEEIYNTQIVEKAKKKEGKTKVPPYEKYCNKLVIVATACMFLLRIQTAIPSIHLTKTFEDCVRSYEGYPVGDKTNVSGMTFIACLLIKTANASIVPWDSIVKIKTENLVAQMIQLYEYSMENNNTRFIQIIDVIEKKRNYLEQNVDTIPEEHGLEKWTTFQPPLFPVRVGSVLSDISKESQTELEKEIIHGDKKQYELLNKYYSRILQTVYGIVEEIETNVSSQSMVLPAIYIDNACCNDLAILNPETREKASVIQYFQQTNSNITTYLNRIHKFTTVINKWTTKANLLFHHATILKKPMSINYWTIEMMYQAHIHYCNYDNDLPLPADIEGKCSVCPETYPKNAELVEKISFLKTNMGLVYEKDDVHFRELLRIIHLRSTKKIEKVTLFSPYNAFRQYITHLISNNNNNRPLFQSVLLNKLLDLTQTCESTAKRQVIPMSLSTEEHTQKLIQLILYLQQENNKMKETILDFLSTIGTERTELQKKKMITFLETITEWADNAPATRNIAIDNKYRNKIDSMITEHNLSENDSNLYYMILTKYSDELTPTEMQYYRSLYTEMKKNTQYTDRVVQHIKTIVTEWTKTYPTMILKRRSLNETYTHSHWGLSTTHIDDLRTYLLDSYDNLSSFINNTNTATIAFHTILEECVNRMGDLSTFLTLLPMYSEIDVNREHCYSVFDERTIKELALYVFYTMLYEMILLTDTVELQNNNYMRDNSSQLENDLLVDGIQLDVVDIDTISESRIRLKTIVSKWISTLLVIEMTEKSSVNMSYSEMKNETYKGTEREKNKIIYSRGKMDEDALKLENIRQKFHLDQYFVSNNFHKYSANDIVRNRFNGDDADIDIDDGEEDDETMFEGGEEAEEQVVYNEDNAYSSNDMDNEEDVDTFGITDDPDIPIEAIDEFDAPIK